jgi:flagellar protein FliS|tara:strand:+ start:1062 stop:1478 length:417 start_codon:yes stop_codon:yes gene_type:complete
MPKNPYQDAAATYRDHAVTTASPAKLVVLIFQRLTLDLERALHALETDQSPHTHLIHAQDLLVALLDALDLDAWEHAPQLANIYLTIHQNLITANIEKNSTLIRDNLDIITQLTQAWTQAETQVGDIRHSKRTVYALA